MSRFDKVTIWMAAFAFVAITAFAVHRTPLSQLISLPILLGFLLLVCVSFARVFTRWRARRWRALIPLGACAAAIIAIMVVGRLVSRTLFAWALPSYEHVIGDIQSGRIAVSDKFIRIPEAESSARLTYAVFAQRQPNGSLFVEFLTERGFPVKHSGYLYASSDHIDDAAFIRSRWPITSHMREHWFYISD